MKKNFYLNFCLILTAMISISLRAAAAEATHTNAAPAAKKPAAHASTKKTTPAPELRTEPLVAGPATVAVGRGPVMLRGKAGLDGEVVGRMTNGESVVVIEEVTLKKSKPDEPSVWAKVALPPKIHAWVHTSYLEPATMTVKSKKLNLRGGPGENYSVVGTLEKGAVVKEVSRKGDWMEIETPSSAYAFMAARYLKQGPAETMITSSTPTTTTTPTEPAPTPTSISDTTTVAVATIDMTPTNNDTATALMNQPTVGLQQPDAETTPQPRIVQREGIVRGTLSIQAPTRFELISPDNRKPINYLYTTSPNLDLSSYKGLHIIVTGEEGLDERWKKTPIITIQRIQVLE